jgi:hypothetical protein
MTTGRGTVIIIAAARLFIIEPKIDREKLHFWSWHGIGYRLGSALSCSEGARNAAILLFARYNRRPFIGVTMPFFNAGCHYECKTAVASGSTVYYPWSG